LERRSEAPENGFAESFIGTFRSECLDAEIFHNLIDAQVKISRWRTFYNEDRPHSTLGYIQPSHFRRKWEEVKLLKEESVVK
jgi:putative transposase